uniref:39S ribosomal protein L4, mitochondrial n=1 Tax=Rhabditophanes sp. KR3021 TaxID=114890 RepID=A0AC35U0H1_9BILA
MMMNNVSRRAINLVCSAKLASSAGVSKNNIPDSTPSTGNKYVSVPEAWVTNLNAGPHSHSDIIKLSPEIFRHAPRLDLLHRNITWQENYRNVQLTKQLTKAEMPGGGRKPWPQKKTGRAHVGSVRSPQFYRGGFAHGVRGPRTWFYMLPDAIRLRGLCVALTIKHAQNDLVVVDDFGNLESNDAEFLLRLAEERNWGYSVLFVDESAEMATNIVEATDPLPSFNLMPVYGLNCFSIMKHETIVVSKSALQRLEERILFNLNRSESLQKKFNYKDYKELLLKEGSHENNSKQPPFV